MIIQYCDVCGRDITEDIFPFPTRIKINIVIDSTELGIERDHSEYGMSFEQTFDICQECKAKNHIRINFNTNKAYFAEME